MQSFSIPNRFTRSSRYILLLSLISSAVYAQTGSPEVSWASSAVSGKVKNMPDTGYTVGPPHEKALLLPHGEKVGQNSTDGALQTQAIGSSAPATTLNFAGVGAGDYGYSPDAAPPDTNGAVGTKQYVQWVNESFAVFDKTTGALLKGPTPGNQLFQALGASHACAINNDGDPIAQFDKAASRWVLTQFSVTNGSKLGYWQCVAVSTSEDATGTYNVYEFPEPNFNDYPKLAVWPDAYYVTFNMYSGNSFLGARACALDRAAMLNGGPAAQVCFQQSNNVDSLLPSDLDGSMAPPAGSPNYLMNFGSNALNLYKFHVDFSTPSKSSFSGPTVLLVPNFTPACNGGTCIPQPGTKQQLDSLADRLMYRLAYRNFQDHESMVVNHSVQVSGTRAASGIRWYEIRNPSTTPSVSQKSTYSPDSNSRWMGSIAMDKAGNIAVGYSVSGTSLDPSIRFAVRNSTDAPNTLEAEQTILTGTGAQQKGLNRWGDYSAITVDPVDDCTFYYTNEYLKQNGTFNWSTRVASFKLASCQ